MNFRRDILKVKCDEEVERVEKFIKEQTYSRHRRKGVVVGISGGVDSAVTAALAVRALGAERVLGLILPEKESNPVSAQYARNLAQRVGIRTQEVDITPILMAFGVYDIREEIVNRTIPQYHSGDLFRLVMPQDLLERDRLNIARLEVQTRDGYRYSKRLSSEDYSTMVAATDIKQRTRMTLLYYYAEKNNYLVGGTTNRSEYLQGFFVKYGDGGVDIEPIAHLYKTQVYQLASYLDIPEEIIKRTPSPDTFSYTVSDKEFYFCLPYEELDLLLYAWKNEVPLEEVEEVLGLTPEQIRRAFRDFASKYNATKHLRQLPPTVK